MRSNVFLLSLAACLIGSTQAQAPACETDLTLLSSILTCIEAIPTNSLTNTVNAAASSAACAYIKSGLGCYSSICNNVLPSEASGLLTESALYCSGVAPSSAARSATATSTGSTSTAKSGSSATAGSASQTTSNAAAAASASASASAASATPAGASSVSSHAKAPQVQAHTMLVKEIVVVAVAGLVGGLVV